MGTYRMISFVGSQNQAKLTYATYSEVKIIVGESLEILKNIQFLLKN